MGVRSAPPVDAREIEGSNGLQDLRRETVYASLLQFSPPILKHFSAIKTKLGTEP